MGDKPVVMMGFGLPDSRVHVADERFSLDVWDRGLRTLCYYWELLGEGPWRFNNGKDG